MSESEVNGGVNIHKLTCPGCDHRFYVSLPSQDTTEETECVECDTVIERTYSFEELEDTIEVEIEIDEVGQDD